MRVVVALGGNALSPDPTPGALTQPVGVEPGSAAEIRATLAPTCGRLANLVGRGVGLVLTHGNGPQVGRLLLQQEAGFRATPSIPPMPMDVCGALSQGQLGYLLAQELDSALRARGIDRVVLALLTQVVVDGHDPAFRRPTKPVGPTYDGAEGRRLAAETGHVYMEVAGGRWRRVVASPAPLRIVESVPLRQVVDAGHVVVACGGGGVPVVEHGDAFVGVEAVVDKDRTAAVLAGVVGADLLLVLTAVDRVQRRYGTDSASDLTRLSAAEAESMLAAGEFPAGSMGPKVRACIEFVRAGGKRAVITSLASAAEAVFGDAGTEVVDG